MSIVERQLTTQACGGQEVGVKLHQRRLGVYQGKPAEHVGWVEKHLLHVVGSEAREGH